MVQLPALCTNPACRYIDANPNAVVIGGDSSRNTFQNVTVQRGCPRCGSDMRVVDGTFSTAGGQLHLDDGPEWTRRTLWEIRTALEYAKDNLHSRPEEARRRVEEISPKLADAIWSGRNAMAIVAYLGLVISTISLIISLRGSSETPPQTPVIVQNVLVVQQREGAPLSEKEIEDIVRDHLESPADGAQ